jgi:hypothetical protein
VAPYKYHPALRSGVYSTLDVLPGENEAAFRKLHHNLNLEYQPDGASERDLVRDIARLTWRKEHMLTYRLLNQARRLRHQILQRKLREQDVAAEAEREEQAREQAEREARKTLGADGRLLDLGPMISDKGLREELDLIDRFDAMIARKIKQLLQIKGMKQAVQLARSVAKLPQLEAPPVAPQDPEIIPPPKPRQLGLRE